MKWEWKGREDTADKSGVVTFQFVSGKASIALADFSVAHHLAQLIHKEIQAAERRGKSEAVESFRKLGCKIMDDA